MNWVSKLVRTLPQTAGVYLMKDRLGQVIYVGKAKKLEKKGVELLSGSIAGYPGPAQDCGNGGDGERNIHPSNPQ